MSEMTKNISGWDVSLRSQEIRFGFSPEAELELLKFLSGYALFAKMTCPQDVERIVLDHGALNVFLQNMNALLDEARYGRRIVVVEPVPGLSLEQKLAVPWLMSQMMGRTQAQNEDGHHLYIVTDRGLRMEEGARYSHTRQGGSFHTDGVNLKDGCEFFLLHCVAPASVGGETVLLDGHTVYQELAVHAPEVIEILKRNFIWEYKGIRPGEFYTEPVLRVVEGQPKWRYFREYIEEAALMREKPLDGETLVALDRLDAILANPKFQFRCRLKAGETMVINDKSIFHGRTPFQDAPGTVSIESRLMEGDGVTLKRTYARFWVN